MKRLLAAGADPARRGSEGSPLNYAVRSHHPAIVALLLERQLPQPMIVDALISAGEMGELGSIQLLAARIVDKPMAARTARSHRSSALRGPSHLDSAAVQIDPSSFG